MGTAQGVEAKSFDTPDETRPFASHGQMEVVQIGDTTVGRGIFEPGWRWSEPSSRSPAPTAARRTTRCTSSPAGWGADGRRQ